MLEVILGCMVFVIAVTVLCGIFAKKILKAQKGSSILRHAVKVNMAVMAVLVLTATLLIFTGSAFAAGSSDGAAAAETAAAAPAANGIGLMAAALSTGLATIGAGIAVAVSASAALGAISENSSILGKTLIFVGLAEGIAIYGLIISIMILNKV